jgi:NAD-dependent deacetylase
MRLTHPQVLYNRSMIEIPEGLLDALRRSVRVVALTGAGVSQESGLRTFRDAQTGLWSQYKPEDLANPAAFQRNPKMVWDWYSMRRGLMAEVRPNPAHYALAEMARRIPEFTLVTQNVDDLHRKAGSPEVIELHGNLGRVKCSEEGTWIEAWEENEDVPRCPRCGAYLRPDVVWFGEQLPLEALERAVQAARCCEVFLSIGTSGVVQPAASLAYAARNRGATVVEVNTEPTPLSDKADCVLRGRAGEVLPVLVEKTWGVGQA